MSQELAQRPTEFFAEPYSARLAKITGLAEGVFGGPTSGSLGARQLPPFHLPSERVGH